MDEPWKEIKKGYLALTSGLIFLFLITLLWKPVYKKSDLVTKQVILAKEPIFKEFHGRTTSYSAYLYFTGEKEKYEIGGSDYKYLKYKQFEDSIKIGDHLTIQVKDENICSFSKNGYDYLDFEKSQYYKRQNKVFARGLILTCLICSIIPLFFKSYPAIKIGSQNIRIKFGWVLIISLIFAFLILSKVIGLQYVSIDEFAK